MNKIYANIEDSTISRKVILKSALDLIQILKSYENLKRIRKEKLFYRNQLKTKMKEVQKLVKDLDYLPQVTQQKLPKEIKFKKIEKHEPTNLEKDILALKAKIEAL